MSAFGTSELEIIKSTPLFGETRYICDTRKMIDSIVSTYDAMVAKTARYPCSIRLHPVDYQYLREDGLFTNVHLNAGNLAYFLSMRVFEDPVKAKGFAQLSICPGCLYPFGLCVNREART